ncbi:MAG TPA: MFS transporter [Acidobacteria bacterium]|nr:MFS transporter [Acidobacteriota bacterium]
MLDSFDVMLYALVLAHLMRDLSMSKPTAGLLGSLTLLASAFGGMIFGVVADRLGRTVALRASILIYSVFTFMCGLSQNVFQLGLFRVFLGLGMGGEWASGAALVSEYFPSEHRGKALGFMQSFWAVGYALAALVTAVVLPRLGWRAVFFVGILPALLVFWIRSKVEEPELWKKSRSAVAPPASGGETDPQPMDSSRQSPEGKEKLVRPNSSPKRQSALISEQLLRVTLAVTLMNALTMFAWWGFNLWLPAYLSMSPDQGGIGLGPGAMSGLIIFMQAGMWLGYISFGFISDRLGRKRSYVGFLLIASVFMLFYSQARHPLLLLFLGPFVAFFGTGYFTGFGALTAEIYPTSVRATAQGITYNTGRIVSAAAPFVVGSLAQTRGFGFSFVVIAAAFLTAALFWAGIPETAGRTLD